MNNRIKVPVKALKKGMFVVELDRPWVEVPLPFQRFILDTPDELAILQTHCQYVFIEVQAGLDDLEPETIDENSNFELDPFSTTGLNEHTPIQLELPRAKSTFNQALIEITELFDSLKDSNQLDVAPVKTVVKHCVRSILSNANALFWLSRIKDKNNFTAEHSIRVSILAIAMGKHLGMSENEMELLGICGMLHDLGKSQIPNEIINKAGPLNAAEYRIAQKHTSLGYELISFDNSIHPIVKDVIHNHHKRVDGLGYPIQDANEELSIYCKIISIIDAYDSMTSDSSYRKSRSAREALKVLFDERDAQFDKELVEQFIKMVGIYPSGSLVKMSNGEVAIVVSTRAEKKLKPKIELIKNATGTLRKSTIIDLSTDPIDSRGNLYKIHSALPDGTLGIEIERYIKEVHHIQ